MSSRLSEQKQFTVLLFESGGTPVPTTYVPYDSYAVHYVPEINHLFNSVPQKHFSLQTGGVNYTSFNYTIIYCFVFL